jgi:hypothetical protein
MIFILIENMYIYILLTVNNKNNCLYFIHLNTILNFLIVLFLNIFLFLIKNLNMKIMENIYNVYLYK